MVAALQGGPDARFSWWWGGARGVGVGAGMLSRREALVSSGRGWGACVERATASVPRAVAGPLLLIFGEWGMERPHRCRWGYRQWGQVSMPP